MVTACIFIDQQSADHLPLLVTELERAQILDIAVLRPHGLALPDVNVSFASVKYIDHQGTPTFNEILQTLASPEMTGIIIVPGISAPFVTQSTLVDLLQAYWMTRKKIFRLLNEGQPAFPAIVEAGLFPELRPIEASVKAAERFFVSHSGDVHLVEPSPAREVVSPGFLSSEELQE